MCGSLASTENGDNARIRLRGPDGTNIFTRAGLTFVHNLLSVTGDFTPQPFVDGDIVCVYNGQIYNQPFSRTDGEVLISLYKEHYDDWIAAFESAVVTRSAKHGCSIGLSSGYDSGSNNAEHANDACSYRVIQWT